MEMAFTILGGLGIFLVGLRMMSNGLQQLAGDGLRALLAGMTKNRFAGIFSGFFITCAVQSSSATTVLVVSFANAGLLTLTQAMGLVMGANIGTTLTAWLVALLGFKIKISAFALPIIAIGFPLSLINSRFAKQLSAVFVGFGLLFFGLSVLKDGVPVIDKTNPEELKFLASMTAYGFGSILLFVLAGTVLTIVVQSSSAASAITLTMLANGILEPEHAAAMILGENIGTTITAQLAAIGASRNAKRVAHFHTLFNLIGVLWMLPLLSVIFGVIQGAIPSDQPTQIAAFHTTFNITNTLLLVGLVPQLQKIVLWLMPMRPEESKQVHLEYLSTGLAGTPELATVAARRALIDLHSNNQLMFEQVEAAVVETNGAQLSKLVQKVDLQEEHADEMEREFVEFSARLASDTSSEDVGERVAAYLDAANDLERISDQCRYVMHKLEYRLQHKQSFSEATRGEVEGMLKIVGELLSVTEHALGHSEGREGPYGNVSEIQRLCEMANEELRVCRAKHARRIQSATENIDEGLSHLDVLANLHAIAPFCRNIAEQVQRFPDDVPESHDAARADTTADA